MIITLNLTITQLKGLAKYLMTLVNKKSFRYSTVIFIVLKKKKKSLLHDILSTVHKYNTRYASKQNLYVKIVRTDTGKQTIGYAACTVSDKIPLTLKELNTYIPIPKTIETLFAVRTT